MYQNFRVDLYSHKTVRTPVTSVKLDLQYFETSNAQQKDVIVGKQIVFPLQFKNRYLKNFKSQQILRQGNKVVDVFKQTKDVSEIDFISQKFLFTNTNSQQQIPSNISECQNDKRYLRRVDLEANEINLIDPVIVRNSKELKSRAIMRRSAKKRIIQSFSNVKNQFYQTSPMDVEYNILRDKKEQYERDQLHQKKYFGTNPKASKMSGALIRSWQQITTVLSMQDQFNVTLNLDDLDRIFSKQPKNLKKQFGNDEMIQKCDLIENNDELAYERKKSLVDALFEDRHLSKRDREFVYSVLLYQVEAAIKQSERLERVGQGIKGLKSFQKDTQLPNSNSVSLRLLQQYIIQSYLKLVKRI